MKGMRTMYVYYSNEMKKVKIAKDKTNANTWIQCNEWRGWEQCMCIILMKWNRKKVEDKTNTNTWIQCNEWREWEQWCTMYVHQWMESIELSWKICFKQWQSQLKGNQIPVHLVESRPLGYVGYPNIIPVPPVESRPLGYIGYSNITPVPPVESRPLGYIGYT